MPRIGTVIGEVYHRPGVGALPGHLEDHYGIRVTGTARLTEGVFRVDHDSGPPWVARTMLASRLVSRTEEDAEILRFLERRILWLSAWQCWLACVSAKVHRGFSPRRPYIAALAAEARAHGRRPA
jgi:hypothetical protein